MITWVLINIVLFQGLALFAFWILFRDLKEVKRKCAVFQEDILHLLKGQAENSKNLLIHSQLTEEQMGLIEKAIGLRESIEQFKKDQEGKNEQ